MTHALEIAKCAWLRVRWAQQARCVRLEYWRWRFTLWFANRDGPRFWPGLPVASAISMMGRVGRGIGRGLSRLLAPIQWLLYPLRALAAVRLRFWILLGLAAFFYVFYVPLLYQRQIIADYRYAHSRFSGGCSPLKRLDSSSNVLKEFTL